MKVVKLNDLKGTRIRQHDSMFMIKKILMTEKPTHIAIMDLKENEHVGYHEAAVMQLLIIIEGDGLVRGGNDEKVSVAAGNIVVWEKGEYHETTTEKGMKAIVIESEGLESFSF